MSNRPKKIYHCHALAALLASKVIKGSKMCYTFNLQLYTASALECLLQQLALRTNKRQQGDFALHRCATTL